MRIEQLISFIEVSKSGSMNAASKKLHVTQQSLNKSLKNLENEVGCRLLDRTKKGIRLTLAGDTMLSAAQDIVQRVNKLSADLALYDDHALSTLRGSLTINLAPMINISILPSAFKEFIRLYPDINIFTIERYRDDMIKQIAEHESEVGLLCVSPLITDFLDTIPENIELIPLKQYQIYVAMSSRHPLADHKSVSIKTLYPYPIIVYEVGGTAGVHAFQKSGHMKVALSTNNVKLCEEILRSDHAIMYSFQPYLDRNVFSDFVHIPVHDKGAVFNVYAAINKNINKAQRHLVRAFINVFNDYL